MNCCAGSILTMLKAAADKQPDAMNEARTVHQEQQPNGRQQRARYMKAASEGLRVTCAALRRVAYIPHLRWIVPASGLGAQC